MYVLTFDTETTGLPKSRNASIEDSSQWPYIVQLTFMLYNTETRKMEMLEDDIIKMENGVEIPKESSEIHKITPEISENQGIHIKDAIIKFTVAIEKANILVAHNIEFDKKIIQAECHRLGYQNVFNERNYIYYDTMLFGTHITKLTRVTKYNKLVSKYPKLIELHEKLFESQPKNLHNSLVDVFACFRCFYKMYFNKDVFYNRRELFKDNPILIDSF